MKKFLCLILTFLIFYLPSYSKIITGEVEYNAEQAKEQLFHNPQNAFNINSITKYYIDKNNVENLNSLYQGITELKDRKIAKFSDGSYGVQYYDDPMYSWYYSEGGRLISFIQKDSLEYPCKITKYKPDGSVANLGYRVSKEESFIFSPNGKLIAHWLGENCYDEFNRIIMKRKIYH